MDAYIAAIASLLLSIGTLIGVYYTGRKVQVERQKTAAETDSETADAASTITGAASSVVTLLKDRMAAQEREIQALRKEHQETIAAMEQQRLEYDRKIASMQVDMRRMQATIETLREQVRVLGGDPGIFHPIPDAGR